MPNRTAILPSTMAEKTQPKKHAAGWPTIQPGQVVRIHERLKEITPKGEEKERIQIFEGMVLARRGGIGPSANIIVRKSSFGVGVEKIFPLHLPTISDIEIVKRFKTRRAKLYFLRHNPKKLKEIKGV